MKRIGLVAKRVALLIGVAVLGFVVGWNENADVYPTVSRKRHTRLRILAGSTPS